ncbi:MAG TPA: glycosyltransferase 87 family protein, partial [Candidatus Limnocylindrales bacterium]
VLLTKATPGVGLLWFVVRREWRQLAIALGVTGALVAVSLVVDGRLWPEWLSTIGRAAPPPGETLEIPLWIRVPAAAVLVVWGALANRRWTVVVAATIALPVLWLATCWSVLAALAAIDRPELQGRPGRAAVGRAAAGRAAGPVREGPLVGMHVDGIQATGSRPVRSSSASGYAVDAHTDAVPLGRAAITDEATGPGRAKAGLQ